MRIAFLTNPREFAADVDRAGKQVKFALSVGINETAKEAQKAQRASMAHSFTLRRKSWADRSVKIAKFAKKTDLLAEIRIQTPGDPSRSDILTQHENGGTKTPRGKSLAIPDGVKRGKTGVVSKGMRPKAFNFKPHGKGGRVFVGDKRTVLIQGADGSGAIYQRGGPRNKRGEADTRDHRFRNKAIKRKASTLRLLFRLTPQGRLKPKLNFGITVLRTVKAEAPKQFRAAIAKAVSTAKP